MQGLGGVYVPRNNGSAPVVVRQNNSVIRKRNNRVIRKKANYPNCVAAIALMNKHLIDAL
jgi:hypothetical protein